MHDILMNGHTEPNKPIEATKALIDAGIFALVGPVGAPTLMAAHPIDRFLQAVRAV
jgi:hypothetical protein